MKAKLRNAAVSRVRKLYAAPIGRRLLKILLMFPPSHRFAHFLLEKVRTPEQRRLFIESCQQLNGTRQQRDKFIAMAQKRHLADPQNVSRFDILATALLYSENHVQTFSTAYSPTADNFAAEHPTATNLPGVRISLAHELEQYKEVLGEARRASDVTPDVLRARLDYLKSAFAAGKMLQQRDAIEYVGRQYMLIEDHPGRATDREIDKVIEAIAKTTLHTLKDHIEYANLKMGREAKVGVFFLSSTQALGHAVLDPYYFLALNRDKFDHFVFIGPPRSSYSAPSRTCLQIVEQYGDYIETHSDILMNMSWMCLGHHNIGPVTLVIDHYWSLLRDAVYRTRDDADSFRHNAWHFDLPQYFSTIGSAFCKQHKIDINKPIITIHARDDAYHAIARQAFRNSAVETYTDAVKYLLDGGYQVVRLGDKKMPRLKIDDSGYFELPFLDGYRHELDSFFISKSRYMIGCQSGPCAFARALGVPILTVNAVLHYTLLPSKKEMACFKRYYRDQSEGRVELSLIEALDARVDQFDNSYRFDEMQIAVESASSEEILAAVLDMEDWIDNPDLPETAGQTEFRKRVEEQTISLAAERDTLPVSIADYIGICLEGYRISPKVSESRQQEIVSRRSPDDVRHWPASPATESHAPPPSAK